MTTIVAFKGAKFHGKGTAADALPFTRLSFATGLKTMLKALVVFRGCPEDMAARYVDGDLKEVPCPYLDGKTMRHAMQTLGTEWGRVCMGEDFWVNSAMQKASHEEFVVFDDLRFQNEADAVAEWEGMVIHVERPGLAESDGAAHVSETKLRAIPSDATVVNDGTPEELHAKVRAAAQKFFGGDLPL